MFTGREVIRIWQHTDTGTCTKSRIMRELCDLLQIIVKQTRDDSVFWEQIIRETWDFEWLRSHLEKANQVQYIFWGMGMAQLGY
jgi:hypothetical protein